MSWPQEQSLDADCNGGSAKRAKRKILNVNWVLKSDLQAVNYLWVPYNAASYSTYYKLMHVAILFFYVLVDIYILPYAKSLYYEQFLDT